MSAPKGNTNALKHGFYSRFFKDEEVNDMQLISDDLTQEIAMLRILVRRALVLSEKVEDKDKASIINAVSIGTSRLGNLMHTNLILSGKASDIGSLLFKALSELGAPQNE